MKFILFFFFPFFVHAQAVRWESSLAEAFGKARKQEKILFVEFYSPGCPHCQRIAPFFKEKAVAELYNSNFVNYQLNVDTDEAREFVNSTGLDVYGIPYFLFFRGDSTLVHAREVSANLNSVLQPGKMVTEKTYTGEHYARRFEAGERSENFLTHYAIFTRVKKDTITNAKIVDALWATYPAEKRSSQASWMIAKKALMNAENGFADYWVSEVLQARAFEAASAQGSAENAFARLLYGTLFSRKADAFTAADWKTLGLKFSPVLGENETRALLWEKEVLALLREGNTRQALNTADRVALQYGNDAGGLTYLADVMEKNCGTCAEAVAHWRKSAQVLQQGVNKK